MHNMVVEHRRASYIPEEYGFDAQIIAQLNEDDAPAVNLGAVAQVDHVAVVEQTPFQNLLKASREMRNVEHIMN
jgi:hypothetical protein